MDQIVAAVNGSPIDNKALNAAMQSLAQESFHVNLADVPQGSCAELRAMALERLIARELIFQAALAAGVVADAAAVEDETARIVRMMGDSADFWRRLAERGMDQAAFQRMVRKDVTVECMTAVRLETLPQPEEAEIRRFYNEHPDRLRLPERVRVSHILLPVDPEDPDQARAHAESLRELAGHDFAGVARRHSICASAAGGGELGFIRRADVDETFADAAFSQIVDEIGPPVRSPYGYHLIKVTAREISPPSTLDESRGRIVTFLKKAQGTRLLEGWVGELRQGAKIEVYDD